MGCGGARGISFRSRSGNQYFYDDDTGFIYPACGGENRTPYPPSLEVAPLGGRDAPPREFDGGTIRQHHFDGAYGFRHLILEVTGQCNLRCKYCVYSDQYPYNREHVDARMSEDTARAAIDYYMENFLRVADRNPDAKPIIGFYGGEPLLNYSVIQESVAYFERMYSDWNSRVLFTVTTNGVLLRDAVQDFLVEHNFSIIVSIDGDKQHHDRNRLTRRGKGSFDTVFANIKRFQRRHPGYERIAASVVYDYKTDLGAIRDFFDETKIFVASLSSVSASSSRYYEQFTPKDIVRYQEQCDAFNEAFRNAARDDEIDRGSFLFTFAGVSFAEFAFHPILHETRPWFAPYTSNCVPGEKLYVVASGDIHMCERINHHHPIGTLAHGLDYDRISRIIKDYNAAVCGRCKKCDVTRFCGRCFATLATPNGFVMTPDECTSIRQNVEKSMIRYVDVAEQRPDILDDVTVEYYNDVLSTVGYIVE